MNGNNILAKLEFSQKYFKADNPTSTTPMKCLQLKQFMIFINKTDNCWTWWNIGRVDAFRPEGRRFSV